MSRSDRRHNIEIYRKYFEAMKSKYKVVHNTSILIEVCYSKISIHCGDRFKRCRRFVSLIENDDMSTERVRRKSSKQFGSLTLAMTPFGLHFRVFGTQMLEIVTFGGLKITFKFLRDIGTILGVDIRMLPL